MAISYSRTYSRARKERLRVLIVAAKHRPCADCGGSFPSVCMDFDHRDPDQKGFTISQAVSRGRTEATILAEIQKCDVVCANCHRIRTERQRREFGFGDKWSALGAARAVVRHGFPTIDEAGVGRKETSCANCGAVGHLSSSCVDLGAIDWAAQDWTLSNAAIARLLGVHREAARKARIRVGAAMPFRGNDLQGRRFGRLVVSGLSANQPGAGRAWDCRCDCGVSIDVRSSSLTSGATKSCGCLRFELRDAV